MRCKGRALSPEVISFNAAISACEKCGHGQHMAPPFGEMHWLGPVARCVQLQRSDPSLWEGWAVEAHCAIVL
eukprot:445967-Karenia_brevis.AAC.1